MGRLPAASSAPASFIPFDPDRLLQAEALYRNATYQKRAVVVLRFDDTFVDDYTVIYPALKTRNLPATLAVVRGTLDVNPNLVVSHYGAGRADAGQVVNSLTTAQLLEMQSYGMELAAHSRDHSDPMGHADSFGNFKDAAVTALAELKALGANISLWIEPGNYSAAYHFDDIKKLNTPMGKLLLANYFASEGYTLPQYGSPWSDFGSSTPLPAPRRWGTTHYAAEQTARATNLQVIDDLIAYGGRAELLWHSVHLDETGFGTTADLTAVLDYIQAKRDAGLLDVLTSTASLFARYRETPINVLFDGQFALQATGAYVGGWVAGAGAPTVAAAVGHAGNSVLTGRTSAYYLQQSLDPHAHRSLRFEGWAKSASLGVGARAVVSWFLAGPSLSASYSVNVGDTWTKVVGHFGMDSRATSARLSLQASSGAAADVLWADVALYPV